MATENLCVFPSMKSSIGLSSYATAVIIGSKKKIIKHKKQKRSESSVCSKKSRARRKKSQQYFYLIFHLTKREFKHRHTHGILFDKLIVFTFEIINITFYCNKYWILLGVICESQIECSQFDKWYQCRTKNKKNMKRLCVKYIQL